MPTPQEGGSQPPWAWFLGGKWTRRQPSAPGLYPVCALDGATMDPRRWRTVGDDGNDLSKGGPWQGWWWDRPLPPIMRPPMEVVD